MAFLGLISCLTGYLMHQFIPDVYAPISVFLLSAIVSFGVVIASLLSEKILRYLSDLSTFAYLYVYLSIVYLAFISNFEPHLTLLLILGHVFFSISFQSFAEFTLFAVSSLILLILSIHTSSPLYFDRHMLVSTFTLITMASGIANWYTLNRNGIQEEYRNLLSTFLNRHSDAIFLLSEDGSSIIFQNSPGRKFLSYIFRQNTITGQALLDVLGLNKQFLQNRFQAADYHVQERCICHLNVDNQKPLKLEILINKVHVRQGDAFMLTLRDSVNRSKATNTPWINPIPNGKHRLEEEEFKPELVEINSLIPLIVENLSNHSPEEEISFSLQLPKTAPFETDVNLLTAAIKHLLLSIIHRQKINGTKAHIFIGVNKDDKFLKFLIQDSGGAIDSRLLKVAQSKIMSLHSQLHVMEAPQTGNVYMFSLPISLTEHPAFS